MNVLPLPLVYYLPTLAVLMALCVWACVRSRGQWTAVLTCVCDVVAAVPACVLGAMRASGASPIRQFNAPGGVDWWGVWYDLWVFAMLGLLVAIGVLIACMIGVGARLWRGKTRGHWALHAGTLVATCVHVGVVFWWTGGNYPDA